MPVCWEPAARRGQDVVWRKAQLVLEGLPSSHWASLGLRHGMARRNPAPQAGAPDPAGESWLGAQLPLKAQAPLPDGVVVAAEDYGAAEVRKAKGLDELLGALAPQVRNSL
jgi:hypothetical protein